MSFDNWLSNVNLKKKNEIYKRLLLLINSWKNDESLI